MRILRFLLVLVFGMALLLPPTAVAAQSPPVNDNFSNATPIGALPFSDTVDTTDATLETGEPAPPCAFTPLTGSVWYAFTPAVDGTVTASAQLQFGSTAIAAYTGTQLGGLTQVGCQVFGSLTLRVTAGTTYYFQTGGMFGQSGSLTFGLIVTPPPTAGFFSFPFQPSIFDTVQFFDDSFDPFGIGIASEAWDLGDGTTATGCCPSHRYATDADYRVTVTVTTFDGRVASVSRVVTVKTHDVAIAKFTVPQAASAGQTRGITVGIVDNRYPETVQVELLKGVPGAGQFDNFQVVGTLTQSVSVLGGNRTTPFGFDYTFTSDDAAVGSVTFEAVATIIGAPDAIPADNTATALPTKVNP